jgi:mercuric ion transport protein
MSETNLSSDLHPDSENKRTRLVAAGGILGALGASACCVVPLLLFSLGISGAWIGTLTALSPYSPVFITTAQAISSSTLFVGYPSQIIENGAGL